MAKENNRFVTYFIIPTYNEEENIKLLSENLINSITEYEKYFLFVDDCSKDRTVEFINKYFHNTSYHIIKKESNQGPGDSFNNGFEWILAHSKNENDKIITIEADNTSDVSILPNMLKISELGYELVLASIYVQGGGFDKTGIFRQIISFFANMLYRAFFNIKVLTISSFYRIYHIGLIKRIKDKYSVIVNEKGFIGILEILLKSIKVNASVIEVPMILKSDKRKGKSKMKIIKTMISYLDFLLFKKI